MPYPSCWLGNASFAGSSLRGQKYKLNSVLNESNSTFIVHVWIKLINYPFSADLPITARDAVCDWGWPLQHIMGGQPAKGGSERCAPDWEPRLFFK